MWVMAQLTRKERSEFPFPCPVRFAHMGIGIDGAFLLMCEGQWREAMTGSISLYDRAGERQHTIYVGGGAGT
jgi:hypothetical protein